MHWFLLWLRTIFRFLIASNGRSDLLIENLALRQQLAVLQRSNHRPALHPCHRAFWVLLSRIWPRWKDACLLVKPATVMAWHRAGFRIFWRWKSNRPGRRRTRKELLDLIRTMAGANPTWGAPRIHGELLKLGFTISERTVSRFMPKLIPGGQDLLKRRQNWKTFLQNHREVLAAMDFLVVSSWRFEPLYILVILDHGRRIVRHFNVTAHPTAEWVKQQLREAFPFDGHARYLIFDRDTIFGGLKPFLKAMGIHPKITAFHSPWQNGAVERMHQTLRRDLLDHVIALDEGHLRRLIKEYLRHYHEDRTHLGLGKDSPRGRPKEIRPNSTARVVALPRCGGLHHRYGWREAA